MRALHLSTPIIGLSLFAFALTCGAEVQEPWWRAGDNGGWCFHLSPKHACLPPDFELTAFESGSASWLYRQEDGRSYFIDYKNESPLHGENSLPGDSFLIVSASETSGISVTELAADLTKPGAHKLSVFVIEFEGKFSIMVFGVETEALRSIANSIAMQWLDEGE